MTKAPLTTSLMVAIKIIDLVHHLRICLGVMIFQFLFVSKFVCLCVLVRVCLLSGYHSHFLGGYFDFPIFFVSKFVCLCVLVRVCLFSGYHSQFLGGYFDFPIFCLSQKLFPFVTLFVSVC